VGVTTGMSAALRRSVQQAWDASTARFGQARALTNARHAATRLSRQRVDREDVRIFLDALDQPDADEGLRPPGRRTGRAAAGSDS
jgi:uncharacterized protein (DUF1778 family)